MRALHRHHLIGSMGQVGVAGDNVAMASITWIERTYHRRRRRQDSLGRLTPIEYEIIMNPTVSLAS